MHLRKVIERQAAVEQSKSCTTAGEGSAQMSNVQGGEPWEYRKVHGVKELLPQRNVEVMVEKQVD